MGPKVNSPEIPRGLPDLHHQADVECGQRYERQQPRQEPRHDEGVDSVVVEVPPPLHHQFGVGAVVVVVELLVHEAHVQEVGQAGHEGGEEDGGDHDACPDGRAHGHSLRTEGRVRGRGLT